MTKIKPVGHVGPVISIENPQPYDWHVWRREPHGDIWLGFFRDAGVALEWVKTQKGSSFVVNNVPPTTSRRYITGEYTWGELADGQTVVPNHISRAAEKTGRPRRASVPSSRPSFEAPVRVSRPLVAPKPQPKPLTAEERKLQAQAKDRIEQHKRDEAADIAAGKIKHV